LRKVLLMAMFVAIALGSITLTMSNQGHQFGKEKEPGTNMGEPQYYETGYSPDEHGNTIDSGCDVYKGPDSSCASGFAWFNGCTETFQECAD
jgi:hypothetical protein